MSMSACVVYNSFVCDSVSCQTAADQSNGLVFFCFLFLLITLAFVTAAAIQKPQCDLWVVQDDAGGALLRGVLLLLLLLQDVDDDVD